MRQKYMISRDRSKNVLTIREYAIIEKDLKKISSASLRMEHYSLLCEETYKSDVILGSMAKGINALVAALRTHNIYPIDPYASKIADSVRELYDSSEDDSVELFFDDIDLFQPEQPTD